LTDNFLRAKKLPILEKVNELRSFTVFAVRGCNVQQYPKNQLVVTRGTRAIGIASLRHKDPWDGYHHFGGERA
jgi:hypothetical protein